MTAATTSMRRAIAFICVIVLLWTLASPRAAEAQAGARTIASPTPGAQDPINADRPGIADGSGVIGRGLLQVEIGFQKEFQREREIETRTSLLPALVRVGLGGRFEGRVETNGHAWIEIADPSGTSRLSGWSPLSLGVKYQIRDSGDNVVPSIGVIARMFPASGSGALRSHRVTGDLRLTADVDLSRTLSLNPNVGIARYEDESGRIFVATLLAVTLTFLPSDRLMPFLDMGYQTPVGIDGPASLVLDAGLGYIVGPSVQLDVSLGTAAHGPGPSPFLSVGISLRSPR